MAFMDEQGVGPCGHAAKEKGILVKVFTSCLCDEIPAELAFSTHTVDNDKNTGQVSYKINVRSDKIRDGQHPSGIDFTTVRCKNKIDQPCTMAPGSTWERWGIGERVMLVDGLDKGRRGWHYVLLVDDEETIRIFKEKTRGENAGKHSINLEDYGQVIKSGWGQDPPDKEKQWLKDHYHVNYDYQPPSQAPS